MFAIPIDSAGGVQEWEEEEEEHHAEKDYVLIPTKSLLSSSLKTGGFLCNQTKTNFTYRSYYSPVCVCVFDNGFRVGNA